MWTPKAWGVPMGGEDTPCPPAEAEAWCPQINTSKQ